MYKSWESGSGCGFQWGAVAETQAGSGFTPMEARRARGVGVVLNPPHIFSGILGTFPLRGHIPNYLYLCAFQLHRSYLYYVLFSYMRFQLSLVT